MIPINPGMHSLDPLNFFFFLSLSVTVDAIFIINLFQSVKMNSETSHETMDRVHGTSLVVEYPTEDK